MGNRTLVAMLAVTSLVTFGCATKSSDIATQETTRAPQHTAVTGRSVDDTASAPSAPAQMICGSEIREVVKLSFGLLQAPPSTHTWANQIFTCNFALRGGTLVLSVQDSSDQTAGRAYFSGLRSRLAGAQAIAGPKSFGLPAFETADGDVVFLKDAKTLRVDASGLPNASLPLGSSQQETAYAIAAAVVGCWAE